MPPESIIPWVTGSGGALVVLVAWVWSEREQRAKADAKYESVSREAIECLAKIVDREDDDKTWKERVIHLLETIRDSNN
jgi:hypothetical protein